MEIKAPPIKAVGIRLNNPPEEELARQVRAKAKTEYKDLSKITKEFWREYVSNS